MTLVPEVQLVWEAERGITAKHRTKAHFHRRNRRFFQCTCQQVCANNTLPDFALPKFAQCTSVLVIIGLAINGNYAVSKVTTRAEDRRGSCARGNNFAISHRQSHFAIVALQQCRARSARSPRNSRRKRPFAKVNTWYPRARRGISQIYPRYLQPRILRAEEDGSMSRHQQLRNCFLCRQEKWSWNNCNCVIVMTIFSTTIFSTM